MSLSTLRCQTVSFHFDEIVNGSRRYLEFWSNDVFGQAIYILVE